MILIADIYSSQEKSPSLSHSTAIHLCKPTFTATFSAIVTFSSMSLMYSKLHTFEARSNSGRNQKQLQVRWIRGNSSPTDTLALLKRSETDHYHDRIVGLKFWPISMCNLNYAICLPSLWMTGSVAWIWSDKHHLPLWFCHLFLDFRDLLHILLSLSVS
jgi:hypothetical protein